MRLGELLVDVCAVTDDQVAQALVVQRASRLRLGATLVALGHVRPDDVSLALARQHGVPAALERHLARRDETLVQVVPAALATGLCAVPVAWSRVEGGRLLVVCFRDPWADHVAEVERATGERVLPAVACETVIAGELARSYRAAAPESDPAIDIDFDEASQPRLFDLVDLDDGRVQRDTSQIVERIPSRPAIAPAGAALPLDAAIAGIAAADASDQVGDLAIAYLRGTWRGAAVLIIREGLAVGHRGFGGRLTDAAVESLVVPLAQPSVLATVHDERRPFVGDPPPGGLAQDRFLRGFAEVGAGRPIAVVPVVVRDRVVSLLFAVAPVGPLLESLVPLARLGDAMAAAYQRLIHEARARRASRPPPVR